jgi:ABC-type transport system substrate-binding protein
MVEENREGNYIQTKRNPNWWFGRSIGMPDMPYFDGVRVTVIPENSVKLANLKAGKIDTLVIDKSQYPEVKNDPNFNVWITPLNFTTLLGFNHQSAPFKDIRMRKAIAHAIDRKALIAANEQGFGRVASCHFPDDHFAHNPNLKPVPYNPELSKKLMAEAGFPKGLKLRGLIYNDSSSVRFGEIIKAMLKRVNIDYELVSTDPVSYTDKARNLEYDLTTFVAIYIKDPDSSLTTYYDPVLDSDEPRRTNNPKVISMLQSGRRELDFDKRVKIYQEIEKVLYDNYEDVWLYHYTLITATRKQVQGYNREMSIAGGENYGPTHPSWFKDGKRE